MKVAKSRLMSFLLAVLMVITTVFGHVDYTVAAEEVTVYQQVTNVSEITAGGNFVLVVEDNAGNYYAMDTTIGSKISPIAVSVANGEVTGSTLPIWTIAEMEGGVSLSNGSNYLNYAGSSTNFGSSDSAEAWVLSKFDDTSFQLVAAGTTRGIAYSLGSKIGAYATSNTKYPDKYDFGLQVFKEINVQINEGACATVKASPAAGNVPVGTAVTLSCPTEGATIHYNTDGTDNYSVYDGSPIVLNADATIKAFSSLEGLTDSEVVTLTYTVYVPSCEKSCSIIGTWNCRSRQKHFFDMRN